MAVTPSYSLRSGRAPPGHRFLSVREERSVSTRFGNCAERVRWQEWVGQRSIPFVLSRAPAAPSSPERGDPPPKPSNTPPEPGNPPPMWSGARRRGQLPPGSAQMLRGKAEDRARGNARGPPERGNPPPIWCRGPPEGTKPASKRSDAAREGGGPRAGAMRGARRKVATPADVVPDPAGGHKARWGAPEKGARHFNCLVLAKGYGVRTEPRGSDF